MSASRIVKPVFSTNSRQAKLRVLSAYKKLQRITPKFWWDYRLQDMPLPVFREVLKNQFLKNKNLQDLRIIDRKVGETLDHINSIQMTYYNSYTVRNILFAENLDPKPKDFMLQFLRGK